MWSRASPPILLSRIANREGRKINGVPKELLDQERDIKIEISFNKGKLRDAKIKNDTTSISLYQKQLFSLQSEFEELKSQLKSEYADYFDYRYSGEVIDIGGIRSYLPVDAAVLEFFEANDAIYSFAITQEGFEMRKHPKSEKFSGNRGGICPKPY